VGLLEMGGFVYRRDIVKRRFLRGGGLYMNLALKNSTQLHLTLTKRPGSAITRRIIGPFFRLFRK
jgi:hypothetical protein